MVSDLSFGSASEFSQDPQFQYNYGLTFIDESGNIDLSPLSGIKVLTSEIPLPFVNREPFEVAAQNLHFPSISEVDTLSVTFFADNRASILKILSEWKGLIQSEDGIYGEPVIYKKSCVASLLTGAGDTNIEYKLIGIFPLNSNPLILDHGSSDTVEIVQNFNVDFVSVR